MRNLIHRWTQSGHFFPQNQGTFFQFSNMSRRDLLPPSPLVALLINVYDLNCYKVGKGSFWMYQKFSRLVLTVTVISWGCNHEFKRLNKFSQYLTPWKEWRYVFFWISTNIKKVKMLLIMLLCLILDLNPFGSTISSFNS